MSRKSTEVSPSKSIRPRVTRSINGKSRQMPSDGATISSGAQPPGEALDMKRSPGENRLDTVDPGRAVRAVPGGLQPACLGAGPERTVALSDGTRITFAAAKSPREMENA